MKIDKNIPMPPPRQKNAAGITGVLRAMLKLRIIKLNLQPKGFQK